MKRYISTTLFSSIYTVFMFVVTCITIDVTNAVDTILNILSINDLNTYKCFINILVKLIVFIFLTALFVVIYFYFNYKTSRYKQNYYTADIVKMLQKNRIAVNEIIVFGYSISFVEPLRDFIYQNSNLFNNLVVRIVVPNSEYVRDNLEEFKPITNRLEVQNGRILEWELLKKENRIKNLHIYRYDLMPFEYGVALNNEIMFTYYYKWNYSNETHKYKLDKAPLTDRKMVKIDKCRDEYLFNNRMNVLKVLMKI